MVDPSPSSSPPPSTRRFPLRTSTATTSTAAMPQALNNTLRRRGIPSLASTSEGTPNLGPRRSSTLSDSLSEARQSIWSSTDDLFLPRVDKRADSSTPTEESHWHSAPLVLALLPAIAGIFFRDGSAFVTDVTLLALAAVFLNWSVRLPWDWYRSSQAIRREQESGYETIESEVDDTDEAESRRDSKQHPQTSAAASAANRELQIHELVALASCFVFPAIGTWLLHAIRSSLSRPSEGLVSNYNLTIFLLASEIRPIAHLLKLVQARTLHLQRVVAPSNPEDETVDSAKVQDLSKRLEELEVHIAEGAATRLSAAITNPDDPRSPDEPNTPSLITQSVIETKRAIQPEIEALNRAVRRYEKRTAVSTLQTDTRLQHLEAQTHDALALAAAAQRSTATSRPSYAFILLNWICAAIVIPAELVLSLISLPGRAASRCVRATLRILARESASAPPTQTKGKSAPTPPRASGVARRAQQQQVQGTASGGASSQTR